MRRRTEAVIQMVRGHANPGRCAICGYTVFFVRGDWLREQYLCGRCGSVPRQRALIRVLGQVAPNWRDQTIFESSPSGPGSDLIARECAAYIPSQYWPEHRPGSMVDGQRCEDLRSLTLEDASVDLVITQDVFEHVIDPDRAFREVARVLRPGGMHVFTVPVHERSATVVRVADDGELLMEADYHDSPVGDGRSLVAREWGHDIVDHIQRASGMPTERIDETSLWHGLRGEMKDVLVSVKRPPG